MRPLTRRPATPQAVDPAGWGRRRLLGTLVAAVTVAVLLLGGLAYAAHLAISPIDDTHPVPGVATGETKHPTTAAGAAHRDAVAAAPMLRVPPSAAFPPRSPGISTGSEPPEIAIPTGTGVTGPAFVMTGFPPTPQGAIGQLAQIDVAVLSAMSLTTAEEVYDAWALPGGVRSGDWWITASVRAFLSSTQMGEIKDSAASVSLAPAAALVKGTDGPDWTTVCVLMKVTANYRSEGQVAFAHCERMQWVGGRWMIAPGTPPAPAPATWPGTPLADEAGWRPWSTDDLADTTDPIDPGDTDGGH